MKTDNNDQEKQYQIFKNLITKITSKLFLPNINQQQPEQIKKIWQQIKNFRDKYSFSFQYILTNTSQDGKIGFLDHQKYQNQQSKTHNFYFKLQSFNKLQIIKSGKKENSDTIQKLKILKQEIDKLKAVHAVNDRKSKWNQIADNLLSLQTTKWNQEIIINLMKCLLEKLIRLNEKDEVKLCCKIFYKLDDYMTQRESDFNQFKRYRWPIENDSLRFHIKKTLIGFLNQGGGIIYIGLFEDQNKQTKLQGMSLQDSQKQKLIQLIQELARVIYPKLSLEDQKKQYQKFKQQLKQSRQLLKTPEYFISRFISMQFNPLVDTLDYRSARDKAKNNAIKYIVKVLIRPGERNQLYHMINDQTKLPEAFVRVDKSILKKKIQEFLQIYYNKQKEYQLNNGNAPNHFHNALCRFKFDKKSLQINKKRQINKEINRQF